MVNVWRAVSLVRPPRAAVDYEEIARQLPTAERVTFQGADGITLSGSFVAPKNGAVVVLVHGLFANRQQVLPEAQLLAQHGYGVLMYDSRAHGDSGGSTATWGWREGDDARKAVDFVQQKAQLPAGKIGLLGLSIGGTAVLRESMTDDRVAAVVVEATYSSMGDEIQYMFSHYGPLSSMPALWTAQLVGGLDYSQIDPERLVCSVRSRPLLLVYGSRDGDVPLAQGNRMAQAACSAELLVINTSTHGGYMQVGDATYPERLLAFFDAHVLASSRAA